MKRLCIAFLVLFCALPAMGQDSIGPPQNGDQTAEIYYYPGKVFARLGTVPRRVAIDTRQMVPLSGTAVTLHTFLWSTTGNATINVDIESSTDCVNWDSVAANLTTESDSNTFEGGFCAVAITIDALSAGYVDISYIGTGNGIASLDGTGSANEVAYFTSPGVLAGDANLTWDSGGLTFGTSLAIDATTSLLQQIGGTTVGTWSSVGLALSSSSSFAWDNGSGTSDVILVRDAANTLALKNGTAAQEFRAYGTTTASKYSSFRHNGTDGYITTSSGDFELDSAGVLRFSKTFQPSSDNSYDVGATAKRIRTGYFGTSLSIGAADHVIAASSVVFNETAGDVDFRIESDTNSNIFKVDAGIHSGGGGVGIGQGAQDTAFVFIDPQVGYTLTANISHATLQVGSASGVITIAAATTSSNVDTALFSPQTIINNGSITEASTVRISAAPSGATANYALFSTGSVRMDSLTAGSAGQDAICRTAGGVITVQATSCAVSSRRYKENIVDFTGGLNDLLKMRPVEFDYKETGQHAIGFIAEELNDINSNLAAYRNGQIENFHDRGVLAVIINAIQEQQIQIERLSNRVTILEGVRSRM